ncbi:MAG: family 10 glycosylhydrolase, partial [Bacteroidota bacterium]|nr:family 10 glycosylhydrolase [Bacteroidota bacterium]
MKRVFYSSIIVLILSISSIAQVASELRGVWITNVDSNILLSDQDIAKGMDYLSSIGINIIFPVMWNGGYTLYPSGIMKNTFSKPIWPTVSGRDPLERLLIEAHRVGIEVVPWMEYGFASSYSQNGGHIIAKYPSWAAKDNKGNLLVKNGFDWMNGINPQVQNFMISLCTEIIDSYDVDGIQGDDRLPAMPIEGGYDSTTVAIYKAEHNGNNPPQDIGNLDWMQWRADKLSGFFQRLRDSIKTRSKDLLLSSAPSNYPWGYQNYLQDSKTWLENGIIDNLIPQIYRYDYSSYKYELQKSLSYISDSKKNLFFSGILAKVGSYVIDTTFLSQSVQENRNNNVKGETYFFYEGIANASKANGDLLRSKFYRQQALLPHRNGMLWRPKATIVNEDEDSIVTRNGNWIKESSTAIGYKPNVYLASDSSYASITYSVNVPYSAWYNVYAYVQNSSVCTNKAPYTIYSQSDSVKKYLDQSNVNYKGWQKLTEVYLQKGKRKVIKLDNEGIGSGKYIAADAIMLILDRKLSPEVQITDVQGKSEENNILPETISLTQNYPNPFNPSTTINFSLPLSQKTVLKVYDLLGREIATLIDGILPAGQNSVKFDASGLASGIYLYQL